MVGSERGGFSFPWRRALRVRNEQQPSEVSPHFSAAFLAAQERQGQLSERYGSLIPSVLPRPFDSGQDHVVSVVSTAAGNLVVKSVKDVSRYNLIFGLGVPASEVPNDDDSGRRARRRIVNQHSGVDVNADLVAEKVRLLHVMAATYLDGGTGVILPTATVVTDGTVQNVQRYIPPNTTLLMKDPCELAIEQQSKVGLFRELHDRWRRMLGTPDFRHLPPDVQAYWRTYPPDASAANVHFGGLGDVVAFDF